MKDDNTHEEAIRATWNTTEFANFPALQSRIENTISITNHAIATARQEATDIAIAVSKGVCDQRVKIEVATAIKERDEYHKAQRTADLEAIREGVKRRMLMRYHDGTKADNDAMRTNIGYSDTLSLIEQIMNKRIWKTATRRWLFSFGSLSF